jgi:hypothetical protein
VEDPVGLLDVLNQFVGMPERTHTYQEGGQMGCGDNSKERE